MASVTPPLGRILTFYSYKGGTGRSMAVANIAWVLACAGRRVLAIDWDLEAPGLHRYFRPFLLDDEVTASEGLMDLVDNYANEAIRPLQNAQTADPEWYLAYADFSNYIVSINFPHFRAGGKIDFLPAGRQGDHYALAVSSFNWQNFYDRLGGGGFFEAVKQRARSQYDYVLIDSRTGVSDTAGICSVQMPDSLVVCFTYNNQSIKGASAVARSAIAMHDKLVDEKLTLHRTGKGRDSATMLEEATRPYRVFPVPMRVDSGESDRLAIRQAFARHAFADLVAHIGPDAIGEYWKSVEVPHVSFYSYEEVLAPFKDDAYDPKSVLGALLRLTRYVTDRDVSDFQMPIAPEHKRRFLEAFAETPLTTKTTTALAESQRETEEQVLARTADAALATLTDAEQLIARRVLGRLVRLGREEESGKYFPIRANLSDFTEPDKAVIQKLASYRVLTIATDARPSHAQRSAEQTVGIADARLLTSWRSLIDWLEQNREFLTWRQQVRIYLADWERSGRDPGALLSGRLLNEADLATLRRSDDLNAAEIHYIDESRMRQASSTAEGVRIGASDVVPTYTTTIHADSPSKAPSRSRGLIWVAAGVILITGVIVLALGWRFTSAPDRRPGPAQVRVPHFAGLPATDAKKTAEALGFKVLMTDGKGPESPFLEGVVVDQAPKDDAPLTPGGTVHLTVSTLTTPTPTIVGMDLTEALKALNNARLKLGKTDSRYVSDARLGAVITQAPSAGTQVASGSQVDVVVARAAQLNDFRFGIYFVDSSDDSKKLAERVRVFLRQAGSDGTLLPRPEQYFVGRVKPKGHEIRYSSPTERQIAEQLQHLLQTSGGFPAFTPTSVKQRPEGFISIFLADGRAAATDGISLTIEGDPGEDVQVWFRGDRETGDAPIVYTGKIGSDGRVVVSVPRAYLMLGRPVRRGGIPLDLQNEKGSTRTVRLPKEAKKS
jgi:cellulose biosynthesis protein BcsQ